MKGILGRFAIVYALVSLGNTVLAAGPPATVTVTVSPSSIPADGNAFTQLTALVRDSSGATVNDGTTVSWTISGLGILSPTSSTTTGGAATSTLRAPLNSGSSTVTAAAGTASGPATVVFTGPAASGAIDPFEGFLFADGSSKVRLVASFMDVSDHMVADGTPVSFTTNLGSITASSVIKGGEAVAVFTAASQPGTATITATCGSAGPTCDILMAGAVAEIEVTSTVESIRADGASKCQVVAALMDADGQLLGDGYPVSFSTTSGSITSSALTVGGVATASLTAAPTTGTAAITATYGSWTDTLNIVMAGTPASVTVTKNDASIAADGASTTFITAEVKDASDNPVADGTVVTFSTTAGQVTGTSSTSGGLARAMVTSASTAGPATLTATCGSASGTSVVYYANAPFAVTLESLLDSIPAGGSATCAIRGTVKDASNNPVPDGTEVSLLATSGTVSPRAFTVAGGFLSVLKSSATAGVATVTATSGGASATTVITFGGTASGIQVSVVPGTLPADGSAWGLVDATVTDSGGRPVPDGTLVSFTTTRGTITTQSATLDGHACARLVASSTSGNGTVTASVGAVQGTGGFQCQ